MIEEIRKKIEQIRVIDYNNAVGTHFLNPPFKLQDIEACEEKHQFRFPKGFRDFITQIGNGAGEGWEGGMGPALGLISLSISKEGICIFEEYPQDLTNPFQYTDEYDLPNSQELWEANSNWFAEYHTIFGYKERYSTLSRSI